MRYLTALLVGAFCVCAVLVTGNTAAPHYGNTSPSVVIVAVTGSGHGSGVYIGQGLILTAAHVAKEAPHGKMTVSTEKAEEPATVLWFNADTDVALLQLDTPMSDLLPATLVCKTKDPAIGDYVQAIGSPLNLKFIHTYGRIASIVAQHNGERVTFIADLTIAPGSSGGPAFDRDGNLVGLTIGIAVAPLGLGAMSLVSLSYIIPKSVLCSELSAPHPAPTFAD